LAAFHVLEEALVGRRLAPDVVMLRQPIHGDGYPQERDLHPLDRDGNHRAGNDEREYAQITEGGENAAQLAMADERLAADPGKMNGLVVPHESQHTFDERVSAQVMQFAKGDFASQVRLTIGIASGAGERALTSDLDRQHGYPATQDTPPSGKQLARGQTRIGDG